MSWQLQAPGIPIETGDFIEVLFIAQTTTAVFTLSIRTILPDGSVQLQREQYTHSSPGTADRYTARLDSGYLIGLEVNLTSEQTGEADAYAFIRLRKGAIVATAVMIPLTSGYVQLNHPLFWPGDTPIRPWEIEGEPVAITVANPAAGANWSWTITDGAEVCVHAVRCRLATDANAANRRVRLEFIIGANVMFQQVVTNVQAASLTYDYNFGNYGGTQTLNSTFQDIPIPVFHLAIGGVVRVQTESIQVGDQYSAITLLIKRKSLLK